MTKKRSKQAAAALAARKAATAQRKAARAARHAVALQEVPGDIPRMLFKAQVEALVGCTYVALWTWMREGKFPLAVDCGGKVGWYADEIADWLESRPRKELKPLAGDKRPSQVEGA
jgi:predicted DNA-binding transcriptional regulator AlpA